MKSLWLRALLMCLLCLVFSPSAYCQVEMQLEASSRAVEVGQAFQVSLTAQSPQGNAANPQLMAPRTFVVNGPSVGTSMNISIVNGSMVRSSGLTAQWVLAARSVGKFTIGPATVEAGGSRYQSRPISIEVVAKGTLPQAPQRRRSPFGGLFDPNDPFDPFGNMPNMPGMPRLNDLLPDQQPEPSDFPQEFATEAALDPVAFLRATAMPRRVYLGQQVRFKVLAYGSRGPFQEVSSQDAARPDFVSQAVVNAPANPELYRVPIGDDIWYAAKIRDLILFPLREGELQIGAMEFGFGGPRYASSSPGVLRRTAPITITVAEPPLQGRPPGYQLGDVGHFGLSATVEPRQVEAGGSVSAIVTVTGIGNPPAQLRVPTRKGIDFLSPTTRTTPQMTGELYGGTKVFTYVIRLDEAGTVDLGEITFPYFNPDTQSYEVAKAPLGRVAVKPGQNTATGAASAAPPTQNGLQRLLQTMAPRQTLTPFAYERAYLTDKPLAWFSLLLSPLLVLLVQLGLRIARSANSWRSARRDAPARRIAEQLEAAKAAAAT
ncbi:MAG TPA: BatD family protein, partial [Polyangiaceae bacterium]|nr:BatD family protein [Polyangiaceae bacterium]